MIEIPLDVAEPAAVYLTVFNSAGKMVQVHETRLETSQRHFLRIDAASLPVGAYILRLEARNAGGLVVFKAVQSLVVQR